MTGSGWSDIVSDTAKQSQVILSRKGRKGVKRLNIRETEKVFAACEQRRQDLVSQRVDVLGGTIMAGLMDISPIRNYLLAIHEVASREAVKRLSVWTVVHTDGHKEAVRGRISFFEDRFTQEELVSKYGSARVEEVEYLGKKESVVFSELNPHLVYLGVGSGRTLRTRFKNLDVEKGLFVLDGVM